MAPDPPNDLRIILLHGFSKICRPARSTSIPWESFRPVLDQGYTQERKSNADRKGIDPLILFKMLILQQLFNLSGEELEFQANDRRSFDKFVELDMTSQVPDATTVAFFRERQRKAGVIEETFEMFERFLHDQGFKAQGDQITDATLIPDPKRRNTRKENVEHGFIRRHVVTPANIHDSRCFRGCLIPRMNMTVCGQIQPIRVNVFRTC
jgi:hypothetical protein